MYYKNTNNFDNLKYNNFDKQIAKSRKLTGNKSNEFIFIKKDILFLTDQKGNIITYSNTENRLLNKFNFYKKQFKNYKKKLNLFIDNNKIYVSDNMGYLYSYDYKLNKILWAKNYKIPFRSNIKISKNKIFASKTIVKNKSIILIDDSLVRGTTCHKIVRMLYESGAKEVHVRIACPEIKFPDFYGVDMPTKDELLANDKDNAQMCDYIKASSLKFLSLSGLYKALVGEKRNSNYPQFSDHYFTGDYPIKPNDNIKGLKVKQLSLLSVKSST